MQHLEVICAVRPI